MRRRLRARYLFLLFLLRSGDRLLQFDHSRPKVCNFSRQIDPVVLPQFGEPVAQCSQSIVEHFNGPRQHREVAKGPFEDLAGEVRIPSGDGGGEGRFGRVS